MEKERVIEIILLLILAVLVFIMVFIGLNLGENSETTISNSYNTDNSQTNYNYYNEPYVVKETSKEVHYYQTNHYQDHRYFRDTYSSWGNHIKSEGFGYYADSYDVRVLNKEHFGKYYTVIFYFEDSYGHVKKYEMRKYVLPDEEKKFYFRDISKTKYDYSGWTYDVVYN